MEITQINNLDNDIYHNSDQYADYWSSSNVKCYNDTPREAYYQKKIAKHETKPAWAFGTQTHDWFASKHVNGQPFPYNVFEPPVHQSGKYKGEAFGSGTKAYSEAAAGVVNPITPDDMQLINDIWQALNKHPYAWWIHKNILQQGIAEPSFLCELTDGLTKYKYRPDVLTDKYIFDWKTITKNKWSEQGIKRHVIDYGYDISAAMYQWLEWKRTRIWKPFIIIWIMKDPPFDFLIDDISKFAYENLREGDAMANNGAMIFQKLKDQHEACLSAGIWPGLSAQYNRIGGIRKADYMPSSFMERNYDGFEIDIPDRF